MVELSNVTKVYVMTNRYHVYVEMAAALFEIYAEKILKKSISYDENINADIQMIRVHETVPASDIDDTTLVFGDLSHEMKQYEKYDPTFFDGLYDSFGLLWLNLIGKFPNMENSMGSRIRYDMRKEFRWNRKERHVYYGLDNTRILAGEAKSESYTKRFKNALLEKFESAGYRFD